MFLLSCCPRTRYYKKDFEPEIDLNEYRGNDELNWRCKNKTRNRIKIHPDCLLVAFLAVNLVCSRFWGGS